MFQIFLSCSQLHLQRKTVKHTVKLFSLSDPLTPSKLKFGHCISSKINQRISKVYTVSDQEAFTVCCNLLCCVWQLAIHRVFTIYNTATTHCPESNVNLCIKTKPDNAGADATVYVRLLFTVYILASETRHIQYCTVASAPPVYIRIFNLFSGQCGLITIVMQNLIFKIPSRHSWIDCCCCCLVSNNSVNVSDPDLESGVF